MSKEIQNRVNNLIEYFKSNPRSSVYVCHILEILEYLDDLSLNGCSLKEMLEGTINKFCIVYENSVPHSEDERNDPYLYDTEEDALVDITEDGERVVSWLEYIEMCVEYEKNHK